ncbi:MAG: hypothetical protein HY925_14790 [Elusimicrobia bacterium]|nr:hypothetical protein [Elusimicrobiota bacterium]
MPAGALLVLAASLSFAAGVDPLDLAARIPRLQVGVISLVGDDHPLFDLADFPVAVEPSAGIVTARWLGAPRWVRYPDGMPVALGELHLSVKAAPERTLIRWRGKAAALQAEGDGSKAELFVPLLEGGEAEVLVDGKRVATVRSTARAPLATRKNRRHAIDHSCSPWRPKLSGLDDAFVTMNCRHVPVGPVFGAQTVVELQVAAAPATLPDGSPAVFTAHLRDGSLTRTSLLGPDGSSRIVEMAAQVNPVWHRLRLALGFGPYGLDSSAPKGNGATGSVMLYANYRLRPEDNLSIRAFDAAVTRDPSGAAFFNNFGLYFAHDLARVMDRRITLTALLGVQTVTFAPNGLSHETYGEGLAPQGLELTYLDAFGRKNRTLNAGAFVQPSDNKLYDNFWLRYGGRFFYELNYISWSSGNRRARMWGVSMGVPFTQLF